MGRMSKFAVIVAILVAAMVVAGAYLYDRSQEGKIANGVEIDGIAVGGMDAEDAEGKLRRMLLRPLDRPLRAKFGERSWKLSPAACQRIRDRRLSATSLAFADIFAPVLRAVTNEVPH